MRRLNRAANSVSVKDELEKFNEGHPWPDKSGIKSLYRFSKISEENLKHLSSLFIEGKLYHPLPSQFNDPFECKPHFQWPREPAKAQVIRKHLIKQVREKGQSRKNAEKMISENMRKQGYIERQIYGAVQRTFSEIRICSFTTKKENLLFWSHYADSHRGFCVEYDATVLPFSMAYKVTYQDDYPEAIYPAPRDERGFEPALIKSTAWEYEKEYRNLFVPESAALPPNDGESLILSGEEIKNVYFGANIQEVEFSALMSIIEAGRFNPGLWQAKLSSTEFKLEFYRLDG